MSRQLFEYHQTFGYRFIPGLKTRVDHEGGGYLLKANAAGFRCDHEFVSEKSPDTFRILLFGDSYTAGDGVSNAHRYGDVLEKRIAGLEVFNFGLSGTGTDQQYLIFNQLAKTIEHDLVVIGVLVENIRRVAARYRMFAARDGEQLVLAKPFFTRSDDGSLELHQVPVPRDPIDEKDLGEDSATVDHGGRFSWLRHAVNRLGPDVKGLAQRVTRYQPLPAYDSPDSPDWLLMRDILRRWISECERPVMLCPIPLYQYIEDTSPADSYRARFAELARDSGALLHDPLDALRNHSSAERRAFRFKVDCHLTPAGHAALANSLAPTIQRLMAEVRA